MKELSSIHCIQTWQTSACLILKSSVGYLEKGCSVDILFFVEQFQLKVFYKTFFLGKLFFISFFLSVFSVCVWCKLWESIHNRYIKWYCPLQHYKDIYNERKHLFNKLKLFLTHTLTVSFFHYVDLFINALCMP